LVARAQANPAWGLEYEDETWFVWVPPAGVMNPEAGQGWAPTGQPPRNQATRKKGSETFTAFLSLDIKEHRLHWDYAEHTNQATTRQHLEGRLQAHTRQGHQVLVVAWDPATWHLGRDLLAWVRQHNQEVDREGRGTKLVPVPLPKGAFWLNPVDALIKHAKGRVLPCRQFKDQTAQRQALDRYWLQRNLGYARVPKPEELCVHLH
jgi:hypothetical protein